jgi:hypothetical protein
LIHHSSTLYALGDIAIVAIGKMMISFQKDCSIIGMG